MGHQAAHRPWRLVVILVLPALLLGTALVGADIDLSFTGVMDRGDPEVDRYFATVDELELGSSLMILLEGPEDKLDSVSAGLTSKLEGEAGVRAVIGDLSSQWFLDEAVWLVDDELFDTWIMLAEAPDDAANRQAFRVAATALMSSNPGPLARVENTRLLRVQLAQDPLQLEVGGDLFFHLERVALETVAQLAPDGEVEASLSGTPAITAQDQRNTLGSVRRLTPLSLVLVLLLFRLVERRWVGMLSVLVPLLLAVIATLGAIVLLLGRLTLMETVFGVTVFGLGIDFAIHLIVRQREERARGQSLEEAIVTTLSRCGAGIAAGAITTTGAFLIVALGPDPIARHLGLAGGIGLFFCLVLMLGLLPSFWTLNQRRRNRKFARRLERMAPDDRQQLLQTREREATASRREQDRASRTAMARPLRVPGVAAVAHHAVRHPFLHLGLAALLVLGSLAGLTRFEVETNLENVFNQNVPALQTARRINELFGINGAPWVVAVDTLSKDRELSQRFAANSNFSDVQSLGQLFPNLENRTRRLEALETLDSSATASNLVTNDPLIGLALQRLRTASEQGPPLDRLPIELASRFVAPNGEYLVLAYATGSPLDGHEARRQRLAAQVIAPDATGFGSLLEAMMVKQRPWLRWVSLGILGFVLLVLMLDLRGPTPVFLALVPVGCGIIVTFGTLCWLGVRFNIMTTLVLPLILGLGVDDGIHVVHRLLESKSEPIARATTSVGRAIVMTTLTTCTSFAVLLFTNHPGMESMAWVMLLGLPLCLLFSISTLPALASRLLTRELRGSESE